VGSRFNVIKHFSKPKKANLTKTPLKKIEKFVEASTWAFGNQP
jgi:carbamate kinase